MVVTSTFVDAMRLHTQDIIWGFNIYPIIEELDIYSQKPPNEVIK